MTGKNGLARRIGEWGRGWIAFFREGVWQPDAVALPPLRRFGVLFTRFVLLTVGGYSRHRCSLHAAGLTYFSLMALAPTICLVLVLARACGAGDFARDRFNAYIDTMIVSVEKGPDEMPAFLAKGQSPDQAEARRLAARSFAVQAREAANGVFDRIAGYDIRAFGAIGVIMLLWTAISTLGMVEHSFNEVWEIPRARPIWKRAYLYALMAVTLPVMAALSASMPLLRLLRNFIAAAFSAIGISGLLPRLLLAVLEAPLIGWAFSLFIATLGFAFFLSFMPNRPVDRISALRGGLVTAFLFGSWIRLCAVAQIGISRSSAMYGSFAVLPIVLTWIYISWQIVLLGGSMTYAFAKLRGK